MAKTKISGLASLATVAGTDILPAVDVSDTTMAPTGTTKRATVSAVLAALENIPSAAVYAAGVGRSLPFVTLRPTGGDDTATINAASAAVAAGGTLWLDGEFVTTGTVSFGAIDIKMPLSSKITYTGTGTAVSIETGISAVDQTIRVHRSAVEWDDGTDTTSVGILITNSNYGRFRLSAYYFKDGIVLRGDNDGSTCNVIDLVNVEDNKRGMVLDDVGTGWANQNEFRGRLRLNSGYASYVGTVLLDMSDAGNGNTFIGVNMEGTLQERTWIVSSSDNQFINCRLEAVPAGSCEFTSTASQNLVLGGYGNLDATTIFTDPLGLNHIVGNYGGKRYTNGSSGNPKGDEHRTNGLNVIAKTFVAEIAGTPAIYGDITGSGTISIYNNKASDATALVQLAGAGSGGRGLWLGYAGHGGVGGSGRIYGHNAANIGIADGNLIFAVDNTRDIGAAGALRPRDFHLARNARIGGALDHDGTTIGEYGATPVAKSTGWGAPTGTATKTTFDTATVTTPELAERVKALLDYFTSRGTLGA